MKLAIAVIHGMGSEDQFFSVELKHRITEQYVNFEEGRMEEDLIFQELHWGDLIKEQLIKKEVTAKRRHFIDFLELELLRKHNIINF